jgi:pyruvate dehydrogenase (quinone)
VAETAADILVRTLVEDWGVRHVFSLPGDGINGIYEALRKRQDEIQLIQVRHEEAAALAACGYAKFTGGLGVCLVARCWMFRRAKSRPPGRGRRARPSGEGGS